MQLKVNDIVSAEHEGCIVEGVIFEIQPYGCEFIDPTWCTRTIVIQDHESGHYSHWRPSNVTRLSDGYTPRISDD